VVKHLPSITKTLRPNPGKEKKSDSRDTQSDFYRNNFTKLSKSYYSLTTKKTVDCSFGGLSTIGAQNKSSTTVLKDTRLFCPGRRVGYLFGPGVEDRCSP
jgi:hypothetical protein